MMIPTLKQLFIDQWQRYFPGAELPLIFYYATNPGKFPPAESGKEHHCIFSQLNRVRQGNALYFDAKNIGCNGGKRYLGYSDRLRPNFDYFLSCGIPGKMEGERYKKSPELVRQLLAKLPPYNAPEPYLIFKRWDALEESDEPEVVVFFAEPDVLSGLFTLANFDEADVIGVITPFSSGCGSIVHYPMLEMTASRSRCVLGTFDVSARPYVPENFLTFAIPWPKFESMIKQMDESFLITESWEKIRSRLRNAE